MNCISAQPTAVRHPTPGPTEYRTSPYPCLSGRGAGREKKRSGLARRTGTTDYHLPEKVLRFTATGPRRNDMNIDFASGSGRRRTRRASIQTGSRSGQAGTMYAIIRCKPTGNEIPMGVSVTGTNERRGCISPEKDDPCVGNAPATVPSTPNESSPHGGR